MKAKKIILATVAVFIIYQILNMLIHTVVLHNAYAATASLWRPDMNQKMWIVWLTDLARIVLFVYIFTKGYENKGWMEGLRYGLWIGLFASLSMGLGTYATMPLPFNLAVAWVVFGTLQMILCGIVAALIYKPVKGK